MSGGILKRFPEKKSNGSSECIMLEEFLLNQKDTVTLDKPNSSIEEILSPIINSKSLVYHFTNKTIFFNDLVFKDEGQDYKYGIYPLHRGINDVIVINLDDNMDLLIGGTVYTMPKNVDIVIPMLVCDITTLSIKYKILDIDVKFKCKNITLNDRLRRKLESVNSLKNSIGNEFKYGGILL